MQRQQTQPAQDEHRIEASPMQHFFLQRRTHIGSSLDLTEDTPLSRDRSVLVDDIEVQLEDVEAELDDEDRDLFAGFFFGPGRRAARPFRLGGISRTSLFFSH